MLGAIIGDIVGSVYEWNNIKTKNFPLFSDTLAAITGGIAEAAYGIPAEIAEKAIGYLDAPLREVYERWWAFVPEYPRITK